jgi:glutathione synthase/RimK-type ligase-like ATP-grasp enzyme
LGHEKTLWVNPLASAQRAEQKVLQLITAKAVGWSIPKTLISNDFDKVKAFFHEHENGIIYKAFTPGKWRNADGSATVLRTAAVTAASLTHPEAVSACPGIYQEHIQKTYELRVTVIGNTVLAAKIDSQAKGKSVDWRYDGQLMDIALTATNLPEHISNLCIRLCQSLDLVFGCIDLIVDSAGKYIFLEVNQAGQFLWNETLAPGLPLLDTFCRFLATGGDAGVALPTPQIALEDCISVGDVG